MERGVWDITIEGMCKIKFPALFCVCESLFFGISAIRE